jgi:hypothetical protein
MVYGLLPPNITSACIIGYFEHALTSQDLQLRTDILALHAEMAGDFFHAAAAVSSEIDLRTTLTIPEDFLDSVGMLIDLGAQGEGLCLIHRINSVFDLAETIQNLLVAIDVARRSFTHNQPFR